VARCTPGYWALLAAQLTIMLGFSLAQLPVIRRRAPIAARAIAAPWQRVVNGSGSRNDKAVGHVYAHELSAPLGQDVMATEEEHEAGRAGDHTASDELVHGANGGQRVRCHGSASWGQIEHRAGSVKPLIKSGAQQEQQQEGHQQQHALDGSHFSAGAGPLAWGRGAGASCPESHSVWGRNEDSSGWRSPGAHPAGAVLAQLEAARGDATAAHALLPRPNETKPSPIKVQSIDSLNSRPAMAATRSNAAATVTIMVDDTSVGVADGLFKTAKSDSLPRPQDMPLPLKSQQQQWATSVLGDSARSAATTLAMACVAGIIGGMLGLGGGMLIGPLLLELGFHPQVCFARQF
jgi:hypothetical protein